MKKTLIWLGAVILAVGVTGCGSREHGSASGSGERVIIHIDGSSTVFPTTEAVAEEFQKVNPSIKVVVGVSCTGGGLTKVLRTE